MTIWRNFLRIFTVVAIIGAGYLIYRNVGRYSMEEIAQSLAAIPMSRLAASLGFAACSYLCLAGFDYTALLYVRKPLPPGRVLLTSFIALSIGHNIGVSALSSGAIRYRFYSRWGLSAVEVGKLIAFCATTVAIGIGALAGLGMVLSAQTPMTVQGTTIPASAGVGLALLGLCLAYPVATIFLPREIRIWKWDLDVPDIRLASAQLAVGIVNFGFVAASLHQLLLAFAEVSYPLAAKGYAIANIAAIISHVPGGLGVLEATVSYLLDDAAAIGALIAFRIIYYFVPLAVGLALFGMSELFFAGERAGVLRKEPSPGRTGAKVKS